MNSLVVWRTMMDIGRNKWGMTACLRTYDVSKAG